MKSQTEQKHTLTVFVPSGYDLQLKQIPEKEYFKKKNIEQIPNDEIPLSEREKIEIKEKINEEFADMITSATRFLPNEMLLHLGRQYASMRNIKVEKTVVKDKHIVLFERVQPGKSFRRITVRLLDILTFLQANKNGDTPSVEGRVVGKIGAKNGNRSSG